MLYFSASIKSEAGEIWVHVPEMVSGKKKDLTPAVSKRLDSSPDVAKKISRIQKQEDSVLGVNSWCIKTYIHYLECL